MSQPQSQPSSQQSFSMSQPQSQQSQFSRHQLPDHPRRNGQDPPQIIYSVSRILFYVYRLSHPSALTRSF
jgi:hypothetical protein